MGHKANVCSMCIYIYIYTHRHNTYLILHLSYLRRDTQGEDWPHKFLGPQTLQSTLETVITQEKDNTSYLSPTLGVLAAGTCGEAAWPAWLDTEVDRLGDAPRDEGRDLRPRGRKAAIPWLAPSAKMNFSRSSMFVLPLAGLCDTHMQTEEEGTKRGAQSLTGRTTAWHHRPCWGVQEQLFAMPTPTQHNKKLNAFLYNAFLLDTSKFGKEKKSVFILTLDTSKNNHY